MNKRPIISMCALACVAPGDCFILDGSMYLKTSSLNLSSKTSTVVGILNGDLSDMNLSKVVKPMDCVVEATPKAM